MSVQALLLIILFILMAVIGGNRGIKSFFVLFFNFIMFFIMMILIALNLNPIVVTVIIATIITASTLFFINGVNQKTTASLIAVILVVLLTMLAIYKLGTESQIQGFGKEQTESIAYFSVDIGISFTKIVICEALIGLLGAITDVAISIASSLNELHVNNPDISKKSLIKSGINIGRDILGTMINTLLFAYISEFMTLLIYFRDVKYSGADIINNKIFCAEMFQILSSGLGIILIIPVTAFITANILLIKHSSDSKPNNN
ncbi:YibE/F family protein [Clostridium sp. 19966]|uniref:YibE/F family protein n=1 Tax=Clostridium sp. 19966 TaxID=2768166 RepID=UPI0028DD8879|nr:YibE/F family protein [Clostridium sp. 19966]MDT8718607.1 YibE/F family protein [Clostridium sp. 19966]